MLAVGSDGRGPRFVGRLHKYNARVVWIVILNYILRRKMISHRFDLYYIGTCINYYSVNRGLQG